MPLGTQAAGLAILAARFILRSQGLAHFARIQIKLNRCGGISALLQVPSDHHHPVSRSGRCPRLDREC
jgi:hypothetical protein